MTTNDDHLPEPHGAEPVTDVELARVHAVLATSAVWIEPAADLEDRVLDALHRAARRPTNQATSDATARHEHAPTGSPLAPPVRPNDGQVLTPTGKAANRWRARVGGALVGLAAASALFAGITIARRPPAPNLRLTLAATALAPDADGHATLTETNSGWQIKLDTRGLVRLDKGRYYEAWLEGPKGIVSIGTFHTGANVTVWAGVEADEYTTLTITIEQEDGNPASSLQRVLTAPIKP